MDIIEIPISDLKPYKNNAKKHPKEQIEDIAKSIKLTNGLVQPIVIDKNNVIVAGHGRYEAAKLLEYGTVPCVYLEDMTDDEINAYRIIDNRVSESEIDLNIELAEMDAIDFDFSDFGIDVFDMGDIEPVDAYDEDNDDRDYFTAAFTFPNSKKQEIQAYLRKHKDEITADIIQKASG